MGTRHAWFSIVISLGALLGTPAANAQFAVVDVGAIAQLLQQVKTMKDQLTTAKNQLTEAQAAVQAMTGGRGMQQLLNGTVRNYLPSEWAELEAAIQDGSTAYSGLSGEVRSLMTENSVLTAAQLAALSRPEREQVEAARRSAALLRALTRQALSTSSARFTSIQQLINAIGSANDQKAILDLQARIAAEQGMLQNEQTKLGSLYQAAQAEEWARVQRERERAIADVGSLRTLPQMGL
jgi:type IV secretion system protein VirB5